MTIVSCILKKKEDFWLSLELTSMCNRMSYFMTPDLLLHGLFNTHSLRQNKFFLFQVKDISHTCKQRASFQLFCKQNP